MGAGRGKNQRARGATRDGWIELRERPFPIFSSVSDQGGRRGRVCGCELGGNGESVYSILWEDDEISERVSSEGIHLVDRGENVIQLVGHEVEIGAHLVHEPHSKITTGLVGEKLRGQVSYLRPKDNTPMSWQLDHRDLEAAVRIVTPHGVAFSVGSLPLHQLRVLPREEERVDAQRIAF